MFLRTQTKRSTVTSSNPIEQLSEVFANADAVVIGAGSACPHPRD